MGVKVSLAVGLIDSECERSALQLHCRIKAAVLVLRSEDDCKPDIEICQWLRSVKINSCVLG